MMVVRLWQYGLLKLCRVDARCLKRVDVTVRCQCWRHGDALHTLDSCISPHALSQWRGAAVLGKAAVHTPAEA